MFFFQPNQNPKAKIFDMLDAVNSYLKAAGTLGLLELCFLSGPLKSESIWEKINRKKKV